MSELDQRDEPSAQIADMPAELERGRECCGRRAWAEACRSLSLADQTGPLRGEDLELLALASYMMVAFTGICRVAGTADVVFSVPTDDAKLRTFVVMVS